MIETALSPGAWTTLALVWLAALCAPGPDVFLLMRLGVRQRKAAVLAALGIMTGNTIWIVCSVIGVTALLSTQPHLIPALQVAGSIVLIWIGAQSIRSGIIARRNSFESHPEQSVRTPYVLGFVTNIANPKALIFFVALLTQFLPAHMTVPDRVSVMLMMIGVGLAWFIGVALVCSAGRFQRVFGRFAPWLDVLAGAVFLLVGIVVLGELVMTRLG